MTVILILLFMVLSTTTSLNTIPNSILQDILNHTTNANKIIDLALGPEAGKTWKLCSEFCDSTGPRYVGTEGNLRGIDLALKLMKESGLENVRTQNCLVRRWFYKEGYYAKLSAPYSKNLLMIPLGGTIGTNGELEGEVIVVKSFDELRTRAREVPGKIVVYNQDYTQYGITVNYRSLGAIEASRFGAIASLVKSVTPFSLATPHTGAMSYAEGIKRIPSAAITVEDALFLERLSKRNIKIRIKLKMDVDMDEKKSIYAPNAIGEIIGSEKPNEIVVIGGHIDSWDVGQGAMDDAGGIFVCFQALRLLKLLNIRPKRTIRLIWWNAEEIGGAPGANVYADSIRSINRDHIVAFESDAGTFIPWGWGFTGLPQTKLIIDEISKRLLSRINVTRIVDGGGAVDTAPLIQMGIPGMNIGQYNEKYFWYHHTEADMMNIYEPREMDLCSASIAVMFYTIADLNERLPRNF